MGMSLLKKMPKRDHNVLSVRELVVSVCAFAVCNLVYLTFQECCLVVNMYNTMTPLVYIQ